ncbi:MAG TPA: hydroxymethylbilane synthase [Thermoplasmata archaeon]|nr:hydroxymethylbilane synthase [Thermoplasmata archaeon]
MKRPVRVGTRRSRLARVQTELVLRRLARSHPDHRFEAVPIETSGDRDRTPGSSPDFTDAIDRALAGGEVDLAVHSAKDLPAELDRRLVLAACPPRADPRDCLVVGAAVAHGRLPVGARVGSSSLRRRAQLRRWRADLSVVEIRGNVDTRIGLVRSGTIDAAILAVAGVARLRRASEIARILSPASFLPAPAQGALAVVARTDEPKMVDLARPLDHPASRACVEAERAFSAALGGDCWMPLGALARCQGRTLTLTGEVLTPDGRHRLRGQRAGPAASAEELGRALGASFVRRGALRLHSRRSG